MVMQANIYVKNSNNFFLSTFLVKRSWKARRGGVGWFVLCGKIFKSVRMENDVFNMNMNLIHSSFRSRQYTVICINGCENWNE